jgi:hypothetical protein
MLALALIVLLVIVIAVLLYRLPLRTEIIINSPPQVVVQSPRESREFRTAPYKQYKPRNFQQMGVLLGDSGDVLPLYGRESPGYRDRYQYYTTTPGEQIYSLTITHKDRECTEDIGCPEFYGNESVTVLGKSGNYTSKIYETEHLRY